jgi:hypothetical protein
MSDNPEEKWDPIALGMKSLIFCNYDFIVFINNENECDWKTSDSYDVQIAKSIKAITRITSKAKHLESEINEGINERNRTKYKVLVCDAISSALLLDFDGAEAALKSINEKIVTEWSKHYRIIQVVTAICFCFSVFVLSNILFALNLKPPLFADGSIYHLALMGMLGATISICGRNSTFRYESSAQSWHHIVESIAKLLVGSAIGCIAVLGVQTGLILSFLTKSGVNENLLEFVAFGFGFSEKLIPVLTKPFTKETEK